MRKIRYRKKLECSICKLKRKPRAVTAEHLKPMHDDQPHTQFVILGKCGHQWKMSADEMGYDTVVGFIKPTLRERLRGIIA